MNNFDRLMLLKALQIHETLTINDLAKEENLGVEVSPEDLQPVLAELESADLVDTLNGVTPATYTITDKGLAEIPG